MIKISDAIKPPMPRLTGEVEWEQIKHFKGESFMTNNGVIWIILDESSVAMLDGTLYEWGDHYHFCIREWGDLEARWVVKDGPEGAA